MISTAVLDHHLPVDAEITAEIEDARAEIYRLQDAPTFNPQNPSHQKELEIARGHLEMLEWHRECGENGGSSCN